MSDNHAKTGFRKKMITLVAMFVAAGALYAKFGHFLQLEYLAGKEAQLQTLQADSPLLVFGTAFLIYVSVTGLSLPGAALLSLVMAWYFGFWRALVLISIASTTGATIAFLLSRFFFRDSVQSRFSERAKSFNESLEREGAFFLFILRLIPVVPFFVINAVMGLTMIRTWTFWWVSQLGMLPGTVVYVYAGSRVPELQTLADKGIQAVFTPGQVTQITLAFALLGIFPLAMKWGSFRPASSRADDSAAGHSDTVD